MKTLDLEKLYNVLCTVVDRQDLLEEEDKYFDLLNGRHEFHSSVSFESFILEYSFSFTPFDYFIHTGIKDIVVSRSYCIERDYEVNEEVSVPAQLLSLSQAELEEWIENRIQQCIESEQIARENKVKKLEMEIKLKQKELRDLNIN